MNCGAACAHSDKLTLTYQTSNLILSRYIFGSGSGIFPRVYGDQPKTPVPDDSAFKLFEMLVEDNSILCIL